jgi:hypothetical protein
LGEEQAFGREAEREGGEGRCRLCGGQTGRGEEGGWEVLGEGGSAQLWQNKFEYVQRDKELLESQLVYLNEHISRQTRSKCNG